MKSLQFIPLAIYFSVIATLAPPAFAIDTFGRTTVRFVGSGLVILVIEGEAAKNLYANLAPSTEWGHPGERVGTNLSCTAPSNGAAGTASFSCVQIIDSIGRAKPNFQVGMAGAS